MKFLFGAVLSIILIITTVSAVEVRTLNDGNLILEDIPEIEQRIIDDLNRYQNVRSAPFQGWNQKAEGLYVSTRFGDVSQIHYVETAGGARKQMTFFKEPISGIACRPDSSDIAFLLDAGGSEFAQIFLLDTVTGDSVMLSDGSSRNGSIVWSVDGSMLAFQSTRRNGKSNDVWVMNPETPELAKLVWESPDGTWWGPGAWSADGSHLLIQQYSSASNSKIYILDVDTGDSELLEGSDDDSSTNYVLAFGEEDEGYYYVSTQFSEFEELVYRSFSGSDPVRVTSELEWGLESFAISEDQDRAAFIMNEDGMAVTYLLDPEGFEFRCVDKFPVGLAGGIEFSPDATQLGITLNTSQSPSDTFVLDLGETPLEYGDLTRWTCSEVGGLDTSTFAEPELIRYESFDGRDIPAFIFKSSMEGPRPVIISIHGGPESQYKPRFSSTFQQWVDKLGATVIAPNVRGSSGYGKAYLELDNGYQREDSVKDIGALLDWIATQDDLDSSRIAVFGGSYGGYMVLACAVHYSDRLVAAVDIVGISNFVTFLENTEDYRRDLRRVEYGDERDVKMREFLESISPNNHVEKIDIPLMVVQGQNDPRVPVTEAEQVVKALREGGKAVWYMNALNEGHGYRKKENRDVYQQAVMMFFERFL